MSPFRKKLLRITLLSCLGAACVILVYAYITLTHAEWIACAFKERFALYCPGCGGSRAVVAMLRLDFVDAFLYYPAIPIATGLILWFLVRVLTAFLRDDPAPIRDFPFRVFWVLFAVVILNFIVRNLLLLNGIDIIGDILPNGKRSGIIGFCKQYLTFQGIIRTIGTPFASA